MTRPVVPIVLLVLAVGLFSFYTNPTFDRIKALRAEEGQFDQALDKSRELQAIRDQLLSRYNTFTTADILRLEKLLPDAVDNVRLALDLDNMAASHGARIRNVTVAGERREPERGARPVIGAEERPYGSVILSFSVPMTYENFIAFLKDLEQSLRLVDVTQLAFVESKGGVYDFSVGIRTYWLK